MMLYGIKGPFQFKTYGGLQKAVVDQSGKNLYFPSAVNVSDEAKDLLRRLIEEDPNKRISWDQFFEHDIFRMGLHSSCIGQNYDLNQSVAFHAHETKVEKLWAHNRNTDHKVEYVKPNKINYEKMKQTVNDKVSLDVKRQGKIMVNSARSRYTHEKKVIVYLAKGSVAMRTMVKDDKHYGPLRISFMNISIILIKYCLSATENMIESISYKNNIYNIEGFVEHFLVSSECIQILTQFKADVEHYKKLLDHLIEKIQKDFSMTTEREKEVYNQALVSGISKSTLLNELMKEYVTCFNYYVNENALIESLELKVKYPLRKAICDIFYCTHFETEFKYYNEKEHTLFKWAEFHGSMGNPDFIARKLGELLKEYPKGIYFDGNAIRAENKTQNYL